jgi:predicted transcriptional regulator
MKAKKLTNKIPQKTIKNNVLKKPLGREPKYAIWMCEIAKRLASEGKKQKSIYKILGITEATGISYKNKYKEFSKALEEGYADPVKVAENMLYKLVKGYEFDSEQIVVLSDGNLHGSHYERVPVKKRIEPNLRAVEFALNNWKPRKMNLLDGYGEMLEISGKIEYKVIPDDELEEKE